MWRGHHALRGAVGLVICVVTLLGAAQASAQANADVVVPVSETDALSVQELVERWLKNDRIDTLTVPELRRGGVLAVAVTLRDSGVVVGFGEAVRADFTRQSLPPTATSVTQLAAAAAERAFAQARDRLELAPPGLEDDSARRLSDVAGLLQVDVQLAQAPTELLLTDDDPGTAILHRFAVGFHGLVLADDLGTTHALSWPGQTLQANRDGIRVLRTLMAAWGAPVDDWHRLGRPFEQPVHRFEVFHAVRPAPHLDRLALTRGQVVIPLNAVDAALLRDLADGFARHLARHVAIDSVRGAYGPVDGQYQPPTAPDAAAVFVAGALLRHAVWLQAHGSLGDVRAADAQAATAHAVLDAAADRRLADRPAASPLDLAITVFALADAAAAPSSDVALAEAARSDPRLAAYAAALASLQRDDGRLYAGTHENAQPLVPELQGIAAAALAAAGSTRTLDDPDLRDAAHRALTAVWALEDADEDADGQPDGLGVGVTVWLAVTQQRLEASGVAVDPALAARLARQISLIVDQQVISLPSLGPLDVYGGIEFDPGPPGSAPRADWRTAQALWLFAAGLRCPTTFTDPLANPLDWTFSAELAARFLAQLRFDENSAYYVPRPALAVGGLRSSLTDHRLDPKHTALALLATLELLDRIDDKAAEDTDEE